VLAYADDLVLIAPSWHALQELLNIVSTQIGFIDMSCNVQKTKCMVFNQESRVRIVRNVFPPLKIGLCII